MQRFEGLSIEDALAAAARALGPDLKVADARRVREGGLMGFFSKERFEVVAEPNPAPAPAPRAEAASTATPASAPAPGGDPHAALDDTLRRLVHEVERHEPLPPAPPVVFEQVLAQAHERAGEAVPPPDTAGWDTLAGAVGDGGLDPSQLAALARLLGPSAGTGQGSLPDLSPDPHLGAAPGDDLQRLIDRVGASAAMLRARLADDDVTDAIDAELAEVLSAPEPPVRRPVPTAPVAPASGWHRERLRHMGVPEEVLRRLPPADPDTDLGWIAALGRAIEAVMPSAGRVSDDTVLSVSGHGRRAAVDLLRAGVQGFTPGYLHLDHGPVPATPAELTLAIRSMIVV